jgi:hypothetical protein
VIALTNIHVFVDGFLRMPVVKANDTHAKKDFLNHMATIKMEMMTVNLPF